MVCQGPQEKQQVESMSSASRLAQVLTLELLVSGIDKLWAEEVNIEHLVCWPNPYPHAILS